jgi:hypothetical protein
MKRKPGRHPTTPRAALSRISRQPAMPPAIKRRTSLETMHHLGSITDRELWAGERFDRGYRVSIGERAAVDLPDWDPWQPRGGIATAEQLRTVMDQDGVGADYHAACRAMDEQDASFARVSVGVTRRIVIAVAHEERTCGDLDRIARKQTGWASGLLKSGLRIYVRMFGASFKREVPGYLRGVGAR